MGTVILYLLGVTVGAWYALKFCDWLYAVRYERRMRRLRALNEAFANGYHAAMGEYSDAAQRAQTYRVVLTTPDRPDDPVRREIDNLLGRNEAARYPKGS